MEPDSKIPFAETATAWKLAQKVRDFVNAQPEVQYARSVSQYEQGNKCYRLRFMVHTGDDPLEKLYVEVRTWPGRY